MLRYAAALIFSGISPSQPATRAPQQPANQQTSQTLPQTIIVPSNPIATPPGTIPLPQIILNNYIYGSTVNNQHEIVTSNATDVKNSSSNSNENSNQNSNSNNLENKLESFIQNIAMDQLKSGLTSWLKNNRLGIAAGSYAALNGYLLSAHYRISNAPWSNWKKHLSSTEMHEMLLDNETKKELSQRLIHDIFKRHLHSLEPTNGIRPLVDFMKTIDQELAQTNRFILVSTIIFRLHLSAVFAVNRQKLNNAKKCRKRATLVKNLAVAWLASCNINNLLNPFDKTQTRRINRALIDLTKSA